MSIQKSGSQWLYWLDRLHSLRFLHECDPSYSVLTLAVVGLPPTEYASLKLCTPKSDFAGISGSHH